MSDITVLEPLLTGPYEFDDDTGKLTIALIGAKGGPFRIVLSNPRPMLYAIAKVLDGKQTLAEREEW